MKKTSSDFYIGFLVCSHKYKKVDQNFCTLYLVYSQSWLNKFLGMITIFLHLPMDDLHLGYIKKIPKKTMRLDLKFLLRMKTVCVVCKVQFGAIHPDRVRQSATVNQRTIHWMPIIIQLWMNLN